MALLTAKDLSFTYSGGTEPALRDLSFSVEEGEFLLLGGLSGSGKSTLLKLMKPEIAPKGTLTGELTYDGAPLSALPPRRRAGEIGLIGQDPDKQTVTDRVWHELAFGLENLGIEPEEIRRRTAEAAAYFGLEELMDREVATLSGGQKQLVNLAAVTAARPRLLLLDEPTAQLDPIGAEGFLAVLTRLNRDRGITVLLAEHRPEDTFPAAHRVMVLDKGRMAALDDPRRVCEGELPPGCPLPTAARVWRGLSLPTPCPLSCREGREMLRPFSPRPATPDPAPALGEPVLTARELWFRYERSAPDVLRGLSLTVNKGEILALLGGNGSGKTTLLNLLAGVDKPYRGKIRATGRRALLPQSPTALFWKPTLGEDLQEVVPHPEEAAAEWGLAPLLDRHPYDLSGGEQQRAALLKVMLTRPEILLLDEPTKGMDGALRADLSARLKALSGAGVTVILATHDLEFAADTAHRAALLHRGETVGEDLPRSFFARNMFYTTPAAAMAWDRFPGAVRWQDIIKCIREDAE